MAKKKLVQRSNRRLESYRPAHNHVRHVPETPHGERGFRRFWIPPQWVGHGWRKCPCGWRADQPEWKVHFAITEHVKWWKALIKKHGSLDAAHKHVSRLIIEGYPPQLKALLQEAGITQECVSG